MGYEAPVERHHGFVGVGPLGHVGLDEELPAVAEETGHRVDNEAVLAALKSGALKVSKIELSDMKPVIYGHAAVVTGASVQRGTYEGQPLADRIVFTDTFIRTGKTWKAVASQRTTAPKQ